MRHACRVWAVAVFTLVALAATPPVAAQPAAFLTFDAAAGELPVSVVVDKVGHLWVSLQQACEVRKYSPAGQLLQVSAVVPSCTGGAAAGGLAVDSTGLLYAAVGGPADVRGVYAVDASGTVDKVPGSEQIQLPNSIAFDHNNGTMYVTDMHGYKVWRVPPGGSAEVWASGPALVGTTINGLILGPNGLAVDHDSVLVSVSFLPRLVRIPIAADGSAGTPALVYPPPVLLGTSMFALDDIALDVLGNVYASIVAGPFGVALLTPDGAPPAWAVTGLPGAVTSVAFGTGKGERTTLFIAVNPAFGGTGSGIYMAEVGLPGRPLP